MNFYLSKRADESLVIDELPHSTEIVSECAAPDWLSARARFCDEGLCEMTPLQLVMIAERQQRRAA